MMFGSCGAGGQRKNRFLWRNCDTRSLSGTAACVGAGRGKGNLGGARRSRVESVGDHSPRGVATPPVTALFSIRRVRASLLGAVRNVDAYLDEFSLFLNHQYHILQHFVLL
jgi:hypothetical protein